MLQTLTSAIETARELRNATKGVRGGTGGSVRAAASAALPGPISNDPFSVRLLRLDGSGGPVYDWRAKTLASPANATVALNGTATVKFTTRYTRLLMGMGAYTLAGQVELRNNKAVPVALEVRKAGGGRDGERARWAFWGKGG